MHHNLKIERRMFFGLACLVATFALLAPPPLVAYEIRLPDSRRTVELDRFDWGSDWSGLPLSHRQSLAPYLIEHAIGDDSRMDAIAEKLGAEQDPLLKDFAQVAKVYAETEAGVVASQELTRLSQEARRVPTRSDLLAYFAAIEKTRSGPAPAVADLLRICRFPSQQRACDLARLIREVERTQSKSTWTGEDLDRVLAVGQPFLLRTSDRPAFYFLLGRLLPERLASMGMPLEAAILAERMTHGVEDQGARIVRARISFYLANAGDFDSALRFSERFSPGDTQEMKHAQLDWMIFAGRYRSALAMIEEEGAQDLAQGMGNYRDYWTRYEYSADSIKLRGAILMYLAGDRRNGAQALEHLTHIDGESIGGAPAKHYARLRLAQMMVAENPELAHRIAEDITYIAQANRWNVLEYHATVIDGWAHYFSGNHYKGLINFIKARGILSADEREYYSIYSHQLGLLTVRNRLSPRGNYQAIIDALSKYLLERPYNQSVYAIREWAPPEVDPDFFLREATLNLTNRNNDWGALNLLLAHRTAAEMHFDAGKNPGGTRGFVTSAHWANELSDLAYYKTLGRTTPVDAILALAKKHVSEQAPALSPANLPDDANYLFSFAIGGARKIYLVHPDVVRGRRTNVIRRLDLDVATAEQLRNGCKRESSAGCVPFQDKFKPLQQKLGRVEQALYVHYEPEFDVNYDALFFPNGTTRPVVYFYKPTVQAQPDIVADRSLYQPDGCSISLNTLTGANVVSDLEETILSSTSPLRGIWLWPTGVDSRESSRGNIRPVYLRRFLCNDSAVRLWDLDRFAVTARPGLVVYRHRANESDLNRAFARHFADQGTALLEIQGESGQNQATLLVESLRNHSSQRPSILTLYAAFLKNSGGNSSMRLILPAIAR